MKMQRLLKFLMVGVLVGGFLNVGTLFSVAATKTKKAAGPKVTTKIEETAAEKTAKAARAAAEKAAKIKAEKERAAKEKASKSKAEKTTEEKQVSTSVARTKAVLPAEVGNTYRLKYGTKYVSFDVKKNALSFNQKADEAYRFGLIPAQELQERTGGVTNVIAGIHPTKYNMVCVANEKGKLVFHDYIPGSPVTETEGWDQMTGLRYPDTALRNGGITLNSEVMHLTGAIPGVLPVPMPVPGGLEFVGLLQKFAQEAPSGIAAADMLSLDKAFAAAQKSGVKVDAETLEKIIAALKVLVANKDQRGFAGVLKRVLNYGASILTPEQFAMVKSIIPLVVPMPTPTPMPVPAPGPQTIAYKYLKLEGEEDRYVQMVPMGGMSGPVLLRIHDKTKATIFRVIAKLVGLGSVSFKVEFDWKDLQGNVKTLRVRGTAIETSAFDIVANETLVDPVVDIWHNPMTVRANGMTSRAMNKLENGNKRLVMEDAPALTVAVPLTPTPGTATKPVFIRTTDSSVWCVPKFKKDGKYLTLGRMLPDADLSTVVGSDSRDNAYKVELIRLERSPSIDGANYYEVVNRSPSFGSFSLQRDATYSLVFKRSQHGVSDAAVWQEAVVSGGVSNELRNGDITLTYEKTDAPKPFVLPQPEMPFEITLVGVANLFDPSSIDKTIQNLVAFTEKISVSFANYEGGSSDLVTKLKLFFEANAGKFSEQQKNKFLQFLPKLSTFTIFAPEEQAMISGFISQLFSPTTQGQPMTKTVETPVESPMSVAPEPVSAPAVTSPTTSEDLTL